VSKKTAATPRRGNRQKQVVFNLSASPLGEADDDDYNSKEDLDYEFDADLGDVTLNTEGLSLTSNESAIDSIRRHEISSEEESDDKVSRLSVPCLESQAQ
jgi:hypothetical protein